MGFLGAGPGSVTRLVVSVGDKLVGAIGEEDPFGPVGGEDPVGSKGGEDPVDPMAGEDPFGPMVGEEPFDPIAGEDPFDPIAGEDTCDPIGNEEDPFGPTGEEEHVGPVCWLRSFVGVMLPTGYGVRVGLKVSSSLSNLVSPRGFGGLGTGSFRFKLGGLLPIFGETW